MKVSELVADLIRSPAPAGGLRTLTPAEPADSADARTTLSFPRLRTVADFADAKGFPQAVRNRPQASANPQTHATPSDPQNPQVPQPADAATVPPVAADPTEQRRRLLAAALREGIDRAVIDELDDADLEGCQHWSDCQLRTIVRWHQADPCALWKTGGRP